MFERREGATVKEHAFDYVFPPSVRTSEVYDRLGVPIVCAALEGINSTLFACEYAAPLAGGRALYLLRAVAEVFVRVAGSAGVASGASDRAVAAGDASRLQAPAMLATPFFLAHRSIPADGQTGSGKTFSLMGSRSSTGELAFTEGPAAGAAAASSGDGAAADDIDEPGLVIQAVHDTFRRMEGAGGLEFLVRVSYLELYQEEIRDLLNPEAGVLRIADDPITGPYVRGLTEEVVLSPERVLELMAIGEAHRHTAATNMNLHSSRSHTLFKMVIESRRIDGAGGGPGGGGASEEADGGEAGGGSRRPSPSSSPQRRGAGGAGAGGAGAVPVPAASPSSSSMVRVASLHFIDLAGSERVSKTGTTGVQLKESGVINASLLTLGLVINKLISGEAHAHIPYRDSKLTRLLSTSLGGNAMTAVLTTVSPAWGNLGETRSSLQFAERAMKVRGVRQRGLWSRPAGGSERGLP
jgi:centromeric protein E